MIWWLDQRASQAMRTAEAELEREDPSNLAHLPPYLQGELRSIEGRPLGGRLWIAPEIEREAKRSRVRLEIPEALFDSTPMGLWLKDFGGIVIRDGEVPLLENLPGEVTDFTLKRPWPR